MKRKIRRSIAGAQRVQKFTAAAVKVGDRPAQDRAMREMLNYLHPDELKRLRRELR